MAGEAAAAERWVMDGNYSAVRDLVWGRATAVVWLNYPFRVVLWRCLSRTIRRAITREELFSGNRESFRMSFLSRDSIILWAITSHRRVRRGVPSDTGRRGFSAPPGCRAAGSGGSGGVGGFARRNE